MTRWLLIGLFLLPLAAYAAQESALYTKTNIIIMRKALPAGDAPLPWQGADETAGGPGLVLDVEVRDAAILYSQEGWYNLASYPDNGGILLVFDEPSKKPIIASSQYAPVDILFINKEGSITQIVPNILLSNLDADIYPSQPVLAFLFVKGGTCARLSIRPGDEVDYKLFRKPPTVLSLPPVVPAVPTAPVPAANGK